MKLSRLVALCLLTLTATAQITRLSVTEAGEQLDQASNDPSFSANGRYVSFTSRTTKLSPVDNSSDKDVFRVDRHTGERDLMSVDESGASATDECGWSAVASDGRVAFTTYAPLAPSDTDVFFSDLYLRDHATNTTAHLGLDAAGVDAFGHTALAVDIGADGRYVAWITWQALVAEDVNDLSDVYLQDTQTNAITLVSVATDGTLSDQPSWSVAVSDDGRYVAFSTDAKTLVPGDVNGVDDVFVRDTVLGTTTRMGATGDAGSDSPDISGDGRYVVFVSPPGPGSQVFRHDRVTGETVLLSLDNTGRVGNGDSYGPRLSADGRYVGFLSRSTNWWNGAETTALQGYVRDIETGAFELITRSAPGVAGNSFSGSPIPSAASGEVAFVSWASDLVPADTNGRSDVFVSPMAPPTPWTWLGGALAGATSPLLHMRGPFTAGTVTRIEVTEAPPSAPGALVLGGARLDLPLLGGVLVPEPTLVLAITSDANGEHSYDSHTPDTIVAGTEMWFQAAFLDPTAPMGVAFSDAVHGLAH